MKEKKYGVNPYSSTIAWLRGKIALKKVIYSLNYFKRIALIKNFGYSGDFSYDDRQGIDITIYPVWGGKIFLQVKSSYNKEEKEKYKKRGIYYIAANPSREQISIDREILNLLMNHLWKKIKQKRRKQRPQKIKSFSKREYR
ncbi:hypothetical protein J7K24_02495 [bacterium]|nr:hypothetical protein [bacterium]